MAGNRRVKFYINVILYAEFGGATCPGNRRVKFYINSLE
jgi:hypothetical protein